MNTLHAFKNKVGRLGYLVVEFDEQLQFTGCTYMHRGQIHLRAEHEHRRFYNEDNK